MRTQFLLFCFATCTLGGCCTDIGCLDGLSLELLPTTPFEVGTYELHADGVDGSAYTCAFTVGDADSCSNSLSMDAPCVLDRCSGLGWSVDEDGTMDVTMAVPTSDPEIALSLDLEGVEVWSASVTPTYTEWAPNGKQCGAVCNGATESLVVELAAR